MLSSGSPAMSGPHRTKASGRDRAVKEARLRRASNSDSAAVSAAGGASRRSTAMRRRGSRDEAVVQRRDLCERAAPRATSARSHGHRMKSSTEHDEPPDSPEGPYAEALASLAAAASTGAAPWSLPEVLAAGLPLRGGSLRSYQGINVLLLWHAAVCADQPMQPLRWRVATQWRPATAHVRFYRSQPDGQVALIHPVSPTPASRATAPVNTSGLANALRSLQVGTPLGDSGPSLVASIGRLVEGQLANPGERSDLHVRLRRSLKVHRAETLVGELAVAFVLGALRVHAAPPAADLGTISPKALPIAARVAWLIARRVISMLTPFRAELWPKPAEPPGERPLIPRRARWEWAGDHLAEVREALNEVVSLTPERKAEILEWIDRRPSEARAAVADLVDGCSKFPSPLAAAAQLVEELARREEGVANLLQVVAPTPHPQEKDPVVALARALREQLRRGTPWSDVTNGSGASFSDDWDALATQQLRTNWHSVISVVSPTHLVDAVVSKGNAEVADALSKALSARSFPAIVTALARSRRHTYRDHELFAALSSPQLVKTRRRENRSLRRTILGREPRQPAQHSLFGTPDAGPGPVDWAALRARLLTDPYRTVIIRRASGKLRRLDVPSMELGQAQRVIAQTLAKAFPGTAAMTAFMPHRSIAWHARMHAGARAAVMMDIEDFFGSVRAAQIRRWFTTRGFRPSEIAVPRLPFGGVSPDGVKTLEALVLRADTGRPAFLPQGAPSSPILANLAAVPLDRRVGYLADRAFGKGRWRYSRYADDLALSTTEDIPDFEERALRILGAAIRSMGWRPAPKKTRTWRAGLGELRLCGIRVPATPHGALRPVREMQRRVRAATHRLAQVSRQGGTAEAVDTGVVSYAYAVTGDPRHRAWTSRRLDRIACAAVGPLARLRFLEAWASG
jgi:hypothetical protein